MKVVVFLQNAWSEQYAGRKWPRPSWLRALAASRSGQRLRSLENGYHLSGCVWWYENASPLVGGNPDSFMQADIHHIRRIVLEQCPDIVLALWKEAARGIMIACADQPLTIVAPHPASRVLTNDLYNRIGSDIAMLKLGFLTVSGCTLVSYKQERGSVVVHPDPWLAHYTQMSKP